MRYYCIVQYIKFVITVYVGVNSAFSIGSQDKLLDPPSNPGMSRLSLRSTVQLLDGNTIPVLGFGTYLVDEKACLLSLKHGYRMLDTASFYSNEEDVGKALRESKVDRSEVCITTKVWDTDHGRERTMESFLRGTCLHVTIILHVIQ